MHAIRAILPVLLLAVTPVAAQPQAPRTLEVPAEAAWQHAATNMILPARIGGLTRAHIRDSSNDETDVVATYLDRENGMLALVYIYRSLVADAPVWFDRALAQIMLPQVDAAAPQVTPFAPPGWSAGPGLRAVMTDSRTGMRSTALAVLPHGPWLIKIRLGSSRLEPPALDEPLSSFIGALTWPSQSNARGTIAAPVEPCAAPLRLRRARQVRGSVENVLIDAVAFSLVADQAEGRRPVYCREPGTTFEYGVYRPDAARDRYLIALNDAGVAIEVGEAIDLADLLGNGNGRPRYSVTLLERGSSSVYPSFNRLPPPEQVLELIGSGAVLSTTVGGQRDR